jgi:DNA-binding PadR family transcriptional regulator
MSERELCAGLIRLHVLHHAAERPVFGLWLIGELERHGYKLSPGTIYPLLAAMERSGFLRSRRERAGPRWRRLYQATRQGRRALEAAKEKVRELFSELYE